MGFFKWSLIPVGLSLLSGIYFLFIMAITEIIISALILIVFLGVYLYDIYYTYYVATHRGRR